MHNHNHSHRQSSAKKNLKIAFLINLGFTVLEIVGGVFTNSIAIISDALHDLGDSLSLGFAWLMEDKAENKGATNEFTFGYARFRLLGAFINSLVLIVGSFYIIYEAIGRLSEPEPVKSAYMIGLAIIGILANGYAAWRVHGGKSLNERVVSWHLLEDVLGWMAVLIVAVVLQFNDWYFLDPVLSLAITAYILWGVYGRLKDTLFLMLQGVPENIDIREVKKKLSETPHVESVHHTHVWSLDGEHHVLTSHLVLENITGYDQIDSVRQQAIQSVEKWQFTHHTLQLELDKDKCPIWIKEQS